MTPRPTHLHKVIIFLPWESSRKHKGSISHFLAAKGKLIDKAKVYNPDVQVSIQKQVLSLGPCR